ncbi:MAG: hypothetical protein IJ622_12145 [Bacteroidales bacterium]|nr:hypothetical protein [Bacteroidales bacterium]
MKQRWLTGILIGLAVWAGCTSNEGDAVVSSHDTMLQCLSSIDSVMQQRPDSALALLQDNRICTGFARNVSTQPYDFNYYQLLLAEALYKNDSAQANRKELQQAMAYYDTLCSCKDVARNVSTNLAFLSARSHYMNGVGYYENDSAVDACKEYIKALTLMEDHFKEKELVGYKAKFMALTYTRLAMLFSDLYLHEQAIYFAQHSLPYYETPDTPSWYLARMLSEIGTNYDIVKQWDSADYYYTNAILCISDTNLLIYRDISAHQAYLKYEITSQSNLSLIELDRLLSQAEDEREIVARSLSIGEIYYHEKQYDSAFVYLKKVFEGSSRTDSKKQAAEWLIEICKAQGREADIMEYADFLVPFANQEENNSIVKSQLTELYNSFRQEVLNQQHQRIVRKNAQWTAVVIGALLIIMLVIICFYYKNKRRLMLIEDQKPEEPAKAQDRLLAFMEEPICQEIVQSVQGQNIKRMATPKAFPELVLTDAQLQQLSLAANRHFVPIEILLEQHDLKAKPSLVNLCHLYLLGMDEKQAAILLNRDYSSVKRYEKTLKTAFQTQENMVAFMRNLVLNS